MKLGFTTFLITDDTSLDLRGFWKTHLPAEFRSTQPTGRPALQLLFSNEISILSQKSNKSNKSQFRINKTRIERKITKLTPMVRFPNRTGHREKLPD